MKVICELYSREWKPVTSIEIESPAFGICSDNPFPSSEVESAVIFPDWASIRYRVAQVRSESCIYP